MFFNKSISSSCSLQTLALVIVLSWIYAICSQITIWLPCIPVPISVQPLPLYLATLIFGWTAVQGYAVYLLQGMVGVPVFAGIQGGLMRIIGPTGGYLGGFLCAIIFLTLVRHYVKQRWHLLLGAICIANIMSFAFGLWRLSSFVAATELLSLGLFPFLIGDFLVKPVVLLVIMRLLPSSKHL